MVGGPVAGGRATGRSGLRVLVPGYPQWRRGDRERALVLGGTFASALAVGLFAWGTPTGLTLLAVAFFCHVGSATDAIRAGAFPGFARGVPMLSTSIGLGLGCYGPLLALAAALAWPGGIGQGSSSERYLVNRWAYQTTKPRAGDWVYFRSPRGRGFGIARVVAGPGQMVEWNQDQIRVGGLALGWLPRAAGRAPRDLALTVPTGQLLVAPPRESRDEVSSCGLLLLPEASVIGQAWAQIVPIWSRRLLF